jgi:hypothetical protein
MFGTASRIAFERLSEARNARSKLRQMTDPIHRGVELTSIGLDSGSKRA